MFPVRGSHDRCCNTFACTVQNARLWSIEWKVISVTEGILFCTGESIYASRHAPAGSWDRDLQYSKATRELSLSTDVVATVRVCTPELLPVVAHDDLLEAIRSVGGPLLLRRPFGSNTYHFGRVDESLWFHEEFFSRRQHVKDLSVPYRSDLPSATLLEWVSVDWVWPFGWCGRVLALGFWAGCFWGLRLRVCRLGVRGLGVLFFFVFGLGVLGLVVLGLCFFSGSELGGLGVCVGSLCVRWVCLGGFLVQGWLWLGWVCLGLVCVGWLCVVRVCLMFYVFSFVLCLSFFFLFKIVSFVDVFRWSLIFFVDSDRFFFSRISSLIILSSTPLFRLFLELFSVCFVCGIPKPIFH